MGPCLVLLVASAVSLAEEADDEALPEALLEFLADSEELQGEILDPLDYERPQWQVLDQETETTDE
ncbi:MAG TPA: hypothetical protein ENK49_11400 [Gammaproteobacteria bacterium]|nr:hypothetical protein [Gammaproteobacteria bacterium]